MVVADNAVIKDGVGGVAGAAGAVCARAPGAKLTSPTAARPTVHLFIFMFLICFCLVDSFMHFLGSYWVKKPFTPRTKNGAILRTIRKTGAVDNIFYLNF
jgi:hypothetical protein